MKNLYYFVVFSLLFCLASTNLISQELRVITEDFKVPKDSCKIYAYDLEAFLKSKGLYKELPTPKNKVGEIGLVKKKLQIGGTDFTKGYMFIVETKWAYDRTPEEEYYGDFLIIEVGFSDKAKATDVFTRANEKSNKNPINIPIYLLSYKCIQVENSVLFICSLNLELDKYKDKLEDWQPEKNK